MDTYFSQVLLTGEHVHVPINVKQSCGTGWGLKHEAVHTLAEYTEDITEILEVSRDRLEGISENKRDAGSLLA